MTTPPTPIEKSPKWMKRQSPSGQAARSRPPSCLTISSLPQRGQYFNGRSLRGDGGNVAVTRMSYWGCGGALVECDPVAPPDENLLALVATLVSFAIVSPLLYRWWPRRK